MGDIKQSALEYLRMGLPIIPLCSPNHVGMSATHRELCTASGKAPLLKNWSHRGTPAEEEVLQWFEKWPNCNIGLILGDTGEYNLVGIDIDGQIGETLLEKYSKGVLPPTWSFSTSNGRRLIYALPEGTESKKEAVKTKDGELAFIAQGQQTVMPPSIHSSGAVYTWTEDPSSTPLEDAPQWLLNIILVQEEVPKTAYTVPPSTVDESDWSKVLNKGERNNHITKLAGSLIARRNIPKEQVKFLLQSWNEQHCDPPLPVEEINVMVEKLHEAEHVKAASMKAKKKKSKEGLKPTPFAESFIKTQQKLGFAWRYCGTKGLFYKCDLKKGPWQPIDQIYLQKSIREELLTKDPEWDSQKCVSEVVYALRELLITPDNDDLFDIGSRKDIDYVYVANGILNWKDLTLSEWNPDTYSTIQLPARWDPEAINKEKYQLWQDTLAEWLPDEGTREFLQEYIGYCLVPDCSHRTAVFLYGPGSNGKSLFLDVVSALFRNYISYVPLHWLGSRFETSKLIDKLVNICGDIDSKYMDETSTIKAMIAGDPIRAEFKHGKSFHFHPVCRLMFSANLLPRSADKSEGWYNRWKLVEFPKRFKTDTVFKRKLLKQMTSPDGVDVLLHWAVEGLRRLHSVDSFTLSDQMHESEIQYRTENDTVHGFTTQVVQVVGHVGMETQLSAHSLYSVYRLWCEDLGVKPVGQLEFTRRCTMLGIGKGVRQIRSTSTNCLLGVQFTESAVEAGYEEEYNFNESIRLSAINRARPASKSKEKFEVISSEDR